MTKEEFKSMTSEQQWKWIIDNKEKIELIELDNDTTYVRSSVFNEPDDEGTGYVTTSEYLGNGPGIEDLFKAIGIKCTGV